MAYFLNFMFGVINVSFRYMLVVDWRGVWYTTQVIFLLDIFYNVVTETVNERGCMTRKVKDSARLYLYRKGLFDLLAFYSIVVTFNGNMFEKWEMATIAV